MFIATRVENQHYNHHGEAIDSDLALWIMDFISSFPEKFWIIMFTMGFIIILISSVLILYLSRSRQKYCR